MTTVGSTRRDLNLVNVTRVIVGLIWLAGAAFNLCVTRRMTAPYEWLEESPARVYRWFFRDVVGRHPSAWTTLLAVGEVVLGTLTLSRGAFARVGLALGAGFSAVLFSFASVYTLVMGPYAMFLAWLSRQKYGNGRPVHHRPEFYGHEAVGGTRRRDVAGRFLAREDARNHLY